MSSPSDARSPVELLADEFLARCKRGEKPTIKEYCDRHPGLAEEIRDVFEAVLMVEDLKPGSDEVSGSFGESVRVDGKRQMNRLATIASCARSAAAAWAWCTRPSSR